GHLTRARAVGEREQNAAHAVSSARGARWRALSGALAGGVQAEVVSEGGGTRIRRLRRKGDPRGGRSPRTAHARNPAVSRVPRRGLGSLRGRSGGVAERLNATALVVVPIWRSAEGSNPSPSALRSDETSAREVR